MINIERLGFDFGNQDSTLFKRVDLKFGNGEIALICGPTGSGKSTFLKLINRLAPTFNVGRASGSIKIDELEITNLKPYQIAASVGYVNQQPESYFVSETVIEELAFGMEQLGISPKDMHSRIKKIAPLLQIEDLLNEDLGTLSAGQQQKVAIGAALAAGQQILLLDEPTSALDEDAAANFLSTLQTLADEGVTILLTEHRFERVLPFAHSLVILRGDGSAIKTEPSADSIERHLPSWMQKTHAQPELPSKEVVLSAKDVYVTFPGQTKPAVKQASLNIYGHEIVALHGPNGAGKSSLMLALAGFLPIASGQVLTTESVKMVPQNASDLLYLPTVAQELKESDRLSQAERNSTSNIFESLIGRIDPAVHPRDLSAGQQLALVISIQLAQGSKIVFLDEPTRGLDNESKQALAMQLRNLSSQGTSILIATHDFNFAKRLAHRTLEMLNGKLSPSRGVTK